MDVRFLVTGIVGTWLVGMGRYWDSAEASLPQKLGLGSLMYIFALSGLLYFVGCPLKPKNWTYLSVLTFISLTSFPAALYALPVERWTTVESAIQLNLAFLTTVATYRVALYLWYMWRSAGLGIVTSLTAAFMPISLIISVLTISGYSGKVLEIMGGLRERPVTANDGVANVLMAITATACVSLPIWLIVYTVIIVIRERQLSDTN